LDSEIIALDGRRLWTWSLSPRTFATNTGGSYRHAPPPWT